MPGFCSSTCGHEWIGYVKRVVSAVSETDPRVPPNYSGVSILSWGAKTFPSILNDKLASHVDDNKVLVEEQNGFRKGRSCAEHIFTLKLITQSGSLTTKYCYHVH